MHVADFEIIVTKTFTAALMPSPFGFYGDILKLVYFTSPCGAIVSTMCRKPAIGGSFSETVYHWGSSTLNCFLKIMIRPILNVVHVSHCAYIKETIRTITDKIVAWLCV